MDAVVQNGADLLRSRNRFTEVLPSGLSVLLRLPRLRDCILAGRVPYPVLVELQKLAENAEGNGAAQQMSPEDVAAMARFQDEIVRRSVVEIDGGPVNLTAEDVSEFSQEDYDYIVAFATRQSPKVPQ